MTTTNNPMEEAIQRMAMNQLREEVRSLRIRNDAQAAEIATLKGEVERLKQCEVNMHFLLGCVEEAHGALPDYPPGKWQERAKALAPAIATLRTQLTELREAAEKVTLGVEQFDHYDLSVDDLDTEVSISLLRALATACAKAKGAV